MDAGEPVDECDGLRGGRMSVHGRGGDVECGCAQFVQGRENTGRVVLLPEGDSHAPAPCLEPGRVSHPFDREVRAAAHGRHEIEAERARVEPEVP
jgi:hypothetical protein